MTLLETDERTFNPATFDVEKESLRESIFKKDFSGNLSWYCNSLSPQLKYVSSSHLLTQQRLQQALSKTISNIVAGFFKDSRLQEIFNFPEPLFTALKRLSNTQYSIGSFRPDFLHTQDNEIVVCEINARFPCNAFLMTQYCMDLMNLHFQRENKEAEFSLEKFNILESLLARFSRDLPFYIFKGEEKGADIHFLRNELINAGYATQVVPMNFRVKVKANVLLELQQHEIMQGETLEHLLYLNQNNAMLNDLRTIFIVHDKRLLSIFHRDDLLEDYCELADRSLLKRHVAETYVPKLNPEIVHTAIRNKQDWLLKPNSLGKGEGIVIGKNVEHSNWKAIMQQGLGADFVLQRFIEQELFPVAGRDLTGCLHTRAMKIVGTMLCLDHKFLGPGIYRASESDVINFSRGGSILAPVY